jgi:Ca2+-binding EF-hand superfamily protein
LPPITPAAGLANAPLPGTVPSRSDNAATAFRSLDSMNRGFVTKADTDRIPGFLGFDNADTNRDGQLNAEEFGNAWKFFSGQ